MKYLGAHVSISGGIENSVQRANDLKANGYALFLKNQRQWNAKPYSEKNINGFKTNNARLNIDKKQILPHLGYLINPAQSEVDKREKMLDALLDEAQRASQLGLTNLNLHPGSHLNKIDYQTAINLISESLDYVLELAPDVEFVLETTAGQGSCLGHKFDHLADVISKSKYPGRIFVCIDTCHSFTAGYDIRSEKSYNNTMEEFSKVIGFQKLRGMHLNDSLKPFNSRLDRHASLGKGEIGLNAFKFIIEDNRIDEIPLILETPDASIWKEEIELLRSFIL